MLFPNNQAGKASWERRRDCYYVWARFNSAARNLHATTFFFAPTGPPPPKKKKKKKKNHKREREREREGGREGEREREREGERGRERERERERERGRESEREWLATLSHSSLSHRLQLLATTRTQPQYCHQLHILVHSVTVHTLQVSPRRYFFMTY